MKKNILNRIAVCFIKIYRRWSATKSFGNCGYIPTCSKYGMYCFMKYDFLKAWKMTRARINSCNSNYPRRIDMPY